MACKISKPLVTILLLIVIYLFALYMIFIKPDKVLLFNTASPSGTYELEVIRVEPGTTVDFSIVVYLKKGMFKKKIYDAYHEYDATVKWIEEDIVEINGRVLNVNSDVYDWRDSHKISSLLQNP